MTVSGVRIRRATGADLDELVRVEREAFGRPDEARLVSELLADPTSHPVISLIAEKDGCVVGHVLLTRARLEADPHESLMLLAPLAVAPPEQSRGIGAALVREGLAAARDAGVAAVLVLGYPGYYARFGFEPALPGVEPPYPLPAAVADAWMIAELRRRAVLGMRGIVRTADALMKPEYWRE